RPGIWCYVRIAQMAVSPPTSIDIAVRKQKPRRSRWRSARLSDSTLLVGPLGIEPRTDGLKVRCSTAELGARKHHSSSSRGGRSLFPLTCAPTGVTAFTDSSAPNLSADTLIWRAMRGRARNVVFGSLLMMGHQTGESLVPVMIGVIIDRAVETG